MTDFKEVLGEINESIAKHARLFGHNPEDVTLVAVTKTVEEERIRQAIAAGVTDIGENRVQELIRKHDAFEGARLHLIGQLQKNKVRTLPEDLLLIHSVDRKSLIDELERIGKRDSRTFNCLLQVNVAGEIQKGGMEPDEVFPTLEYVESLERVRVSGLMQIAPFAEDPEDVRKYFRTMRKLFEKAGEFGYNNSKMLHLSMGMSHDYRIALEEGANMVRIGSAIFGERHYN